MYIFPSLLGLFPRQHLGGVRSALELPKKWTNYKVYKTTPTPPCLILFKAAAARSRCINRFYYISTMNSSTPLSSVYKVVRKISRKHHKNPMTILRFGHSPSDVISAPGAVADVIGFHYASCSSESRYLKPFRTLILRERSPDFSIPWGVDLPWNRLFTMAEFQEALHLCRNGDTSFPSDCFSFSTELV